MTRRSAAVLGRARAGRSCSPASSPEPAVERLERSLDDPTPPAGELTERALRYARGAHSVWGSPRPVARLEELIDRLGDQATIPS